MAEDEEKNDPTWKPGDLQPNVPVKIKLLSGKAIATGESKFGTWNLWTANVENQKVHNKDTKQVIEGFTGEVVFFPSTKLNENLLVATEGRKVDVEVEIMLVPKKSPKGGFYTTYAVKKLSEGTIPPESVSFSHNQYLEDFEKIVGLGTCERNKEMFFMFGCQNPHFLTEQQLTDLWEVYQEKYMKQ